MNDIIFIICAIFISICGGALVTYLLLRKKLFITRIEDEYIAQENERLADENRKLTYEGIYLEEKMENLLQSIEQMNNYLITRQSQDEEALKNFYEQCERVAVERFERALEKERNKYLETIEQYKVQLALTMEEGAQEFQNNIAEQDSRCKELTQQITELQTTADAAVAAAKRAEEIKQEANFYKLQLSDLDVEEIRILRNVSPYLRDKEPLNKVIWKVYYEKPTTDLIGRVIGSGVHTGIYKITNLDNQMCYVGQAANLADRWKQHIKRGIGAETPTKNKLYPIMIALGVENFSFEVIEECPREKLDEREDYWQEYFKAKEFGYSIK